MIVDAKTRWHGHGRGFSGTIQRHGNRRTGRTGSPIQPTLCHMVAMVGLGLIVDGRNLDDHPGPNDGVYPEPIRRSWGCWSLGEAVSLAKLKEQDRWDNLARQQREPAPPPPSPSLAPPSPIPRWPSNPASAARDKAPAPLGAGDLERLTRPATVLDLHQDHVLYWRFHEKPGWFPAGRPGTVARVENWQSGYCDSSSGVLVKVRGFVGWKDLGWFRTETVPPT